MLAYLDAGSGSLLLQLVVGGLAGIAAFARFRWTRVRDRIRGKAEAKVEAKDS